MKQFLSALLRKKTLKQKHENVILSRSNKFYILKK